jgi:hypothetical protein
MNRQYQPHNLYPTINKATDISGFILYMKSPTCSGFFCGKLCIGRTKYKEPARVREILGGPLIITAVIAYAVNK